MRCYVSSCRLMVLGACVTAILIATALHGAEQDRFDPVKQFDHIGIFTAEKMPGARLVEASKVWVTDIPSHPFRVEWLCVDDPAGRTVLRGPHVAFRVASIAEASKGPGLKTCSKPFDAGIAMVGFCQTEDGATVEFMEYRSTEGAPSRSDRAEGDGPRSPAMQFDHVGFITDEKKPGERFVLATKVWVTDIAAHPYRIEWLRFEPDSPVTGPVRHQPHIAFRVESIAEASKGLKVLLEPFDAGIAKVGFYQAADGAVVEFMEYYKQSDTE